MAGAQILGGLAAPWIRRRFRRRTSALLATAALSSLTLALIGLVDSFWAVLALIVVWGLLFAATRPIRQTYLNGLIPSRERATILSFDSLMSSTGGVWTQPVLGRAADLWGYAPSYLMGAGISALALPFLALSRRQNAPADMVERAAPRPLPSRPDALRGRERRNGLDRGRRARRPATRMPTPTARAAPARPTRPPAPTEPSALASWAGMPMYRAQSVALSRPSAIRIPAPSRRGR